MDPAEIDRYLSGRPGRSDSATPGTGQRTPSSNTANQLSQLQNAVGRRTSQPQDEIASQQTFRGQSARRPAPQPEPQRQPAEYPGYYDDESYADYTDETFDVDPRPSAVEHQNEDDAVWEEPAPPPRRQTPSQRTSQRPISRQPRRVPRYEPDPIDSYDDEEFYNDDPYLSYEDEQLDRRPPRAQRPRQQVKISKPNLPKVTIPRSVTDSPLLGDMPSLVMIGMSIVSLAIMAFIVSDRITLLGETIPTHVSASGDPENLKTREAVWNIPLLAGMVMLMNIAASWFISRIDRFATRFLLSAGLLIHFIAWVALIKYLWE